MGLACAMSNSVENILFRSVIPLTAGEIASSARMSLEQVNRELKLLVNNEKVLRIRLPGSEEAKFKLATAYVHDDSDPKLDRQLLIIQLAISESEESAALLDTPSVAGSETKAR